MTVEYKGIDLVRAATIIDTEGTIFLHTKRKLLPRGDVVYVYLEVHVAMKTPQLPQWLQQTFGGTYYIVKNQKTGWGHRFDVQHWTIRANQARQFLKLIEPYLMIKQPQARLGIKFQNRKKGYNGIEYCTGRRTIEISAYEMYIRECFWKKMKQLNGSIKSEPNKYLKVA